MSLSPEFFLKMMVNILLFTIRGLVLALHFHRLYRHGLSMTRTFHVGILYRFASTIAPSTIKKDKLTFICLGHRKISVNEDVFAVFTTLLTSRTFLTVDYLLLCFLIPSPLLFDLMSKIKVSTSTAGR